MTTGSLQRRAKFVGLEVDHRAPDHYRARVELEWRGTIYEGTAERMGGPAPQERCAAEAVANSLGQITRGGGVSFEILDLEEVNAFGRPAVIVALSIHHQDEPLYAVGFCLAEEEIPEAAVKSVLNATNRFLQRLSSPPSDSLTVPVTH